MAQTTTSKSCLQTLRNIRVFLVDKLEWHIDSVVDLLITKDVFSRDDREDVLFEKGPRGKVRKVLDILDCKGEEAAKVFVSACSYLWEPSLKTLQQPWEQTTDYQKIIAKHKAALKRRSESMLYYNTRHGEKIPFSEHYVNLLIVKGHHSLEIKRHEVLTFGQQRISLQQKASEKFIKPAQLFSNETGMQPNKKILVTGVAGIGKTVLVQKILCDFSNDKEYTSFDFIIHLTFRDLNLIRRPISFRELILRKNGHLAKHLDTITENDVKLLIILDGFDEFKHYRACDADVFLTEIDEEGEVPEVLSSLILGELLPRASVLVTSRPMAVGYIPVGAIDCFVVITGFSTTEIHDFFQRFFQDQDVASRMFDTVAANELMLTLCYIPAFCHIVCRILKDSDCLSTASPRTMTDIYVQYLLALVKSHMKNRVETLNVNSRIQDQEHLQKILIKLGRLAYQKLMKQETLFYSNDDEIMNCAMVSTFLDKTSIQEPGCTEDIYSFTHLTIQEFFAALYSAMADVPLSETLGSSIESTTGNLDLFARFLSGLLSKRNQELLNRNIGFEMHEDKMQSFRIRLVSDTQTLCENGAYILTHLHCILEQQDVLLIQELQPQSLRINLSDVSLSLMDHNAVKYFLSEIQMTIFELDLTGTNTSAKALKDLEPYLLRCENLWLGENSLDMEAVKVVAGVLEASDTLKQIGLGWTDIGDEELSVLTKAIKVKKKLSEIWMEGNRIGFAGLTSLSDLTPCPLTRVVAIWNNVTDDEAERLNSLYPGQCFVVSFTDDSMWEGWAQWVLQRCEVSSSEKLVTFLQKVCDISLCSLESSWARTFFGTLTQLIRTRIEQCLEEDVRRKLVKFEAILNL
ncbi:NLR family CARD domain-containing protein 3-like [Electrophorus electricus]|uniref:NLR family CARD domain-containing protein 3-like n=1 Tax=Electrophorus electricus TaxID=8005 RepID=UPI0015D052C3|nr:NLR family CARD domain-containing protein 3-like [Electrophorus electricus]